jgi:hypothetical protein
MHRRLDGVAPKIAWLATERAFHELNGSEKHYAIVLQAEHPVCPQEKSLCEGGCYA